VAKLSFRTDNYPRKRKADWSALSPSIHWAQRHERTPQFKWSRRIYDFEFLYVQQGEIRATLGTNEYMVPAGNLLYIPSGISHSIHVVTDPHATFLGIHFDYFDELEIYRDEDIIINEDKINPNYYCCEPDLDGSLLFPEQPMQIPDPHVITLMEALIHEFTLQNTAYPLVCKGLLLQILALLLRGQNDSKRSFHPKYGDRILELAHLMESKYAQNWSGEEISNYLNIHCDYAARLFKEVLGVSPNKYLQAIRHQVAKTLLRETDWKMETIAHHVGYEDVHYFSRVFSKREGITASDYRRLTKML
jgi:AraC-like DNA-binding protein